MWIGFVLRANKVDYNSHLFYLTEAQAHWIIIAQVYCKCI